MMGVRETLNPILLIIEIIVFIFVLIFAFLLRNKKTTPMYKTACVLLVVTLIATIIISLTTGFLEDYIRYCRWYITNDNCLFGCEIFFGYPPKLNTFLVLRVFNTNIATLLLLILIIQIMSLTKGNNEYLE